MEPVVDGQTNQSNAFSPLFVFTVSFWRQKNVTHLQSEFVWARLLCVCAEMWVCMLCGNDMQPVSLLFPLPRLFNTWIFYTADHFFFVTRSGSPTVMTIKGVPMWKVNYLLFYEKSTDHVTKVWAWFTQIPSGFIQKCLCGCVMSRSFLECIYNFGNLFSSYWTAAVYIILRVTSLTPLCFHRPVLM